MSQRKGQILGVLERIYSGIRYIGRKGELEECKKSD